jgi:GAF domain-containing protein
VIAAEFETAFERAVRVQIGAGELPWLSLPQLCAACAELTSLRASIVLVAFGHPQIAMAASDGASAVEDLQFKLGEGPSVDAYVERHPVLVQDLPAEASRWTRFVTEAEVLGVRAVFAYPLQMGGIRIGVLSLYADRTNSVDDEQLWDLAKLASLVTAAVLAMQSGMTLDQLGWSLANAAEHRSVVHQAIGMITIQLECSAPDAFVRMQARAFSDGTEMEEVARLVVKRILRFEP